MPLEAKAVAGALIKGTLQITGVDEVITDKATEFYDAKYKIPHLISSIEIQLNDKYGSYVFYNNLCAYINENSFIENVIRMLLYGVNSSDFIPQNKFAEENKNRFCEKYKGYSSYESSLIKECFDFIYEIVLCGVAKLNPHSDVGKLQISNAVQFGKLGEDYGEIKELIRGLDTKMSQLLSINTIMKSSNDDFGQTPEAVTEYLKKIENVDKDTLGGDPEMCLSKYREILSDALIMLRGEMEAQVDKVICAANSYMAICYGNLGNVEKAFECLEKVSPVTAEESKLYQFVKAVLIVNHGLEDKYVEATKCLNRALELDPNHRRAYLVRQYLMALQKEASLEGVLGSLDEYFEKIVSEGKERDLIADYYIYRGFICKEFKEFASAEKDFVFAKEYGYDEIIVDYNLALLFYGIATRELPKDTRIFCSNVVDVSMLKKTIELLRLWLIEKKEEKFPEYIKSRMVGVYVSSCALLGIKHELTPLDEYLKLPNMEYEIQRMLIMGTDIIADKETIGILDEDDALYVRLANKVNGNQYSDVKKILLLMSEDERKALPVTTVYLILQASIINKDIETYNDFRKHITMSDAIGRIECLDAYAKEESGELESAKSIFDKYAAISSDYHQLRNIVGFYARNNYDMECEQLLVRILNLLKRDEIYIDETADFFQQAIEFLVSHKSEYAKIFVEVADIENEQMWRAKAYYYDAINDIPRLLEMTALLYQSTREFSMGYKEIVCLVKMMNYDAALVKARELLATVHQSNINNRIQVIWMLSDLCLFLGQYQESFEWAKKAHELALDTPSNASHGAYLMRATRVGRAGESLASIVKYKERHPVVISEWMKEVEISEHNSGEELLVALENAVGQSHEEYVQKEKEFGVLYRKGLLPNSTIVERNGKDIAQLFIFAGKNKLRISRGNWEAIEEKKAFVGEHVLVDSLTLIIMQKYGCLDAIKKIKYVHICYSTLSALQDIYPSLNHYYVEPILEWISKADNIIFEPDGYRTEEPMTNVLSDELLTCCWVADKLELPLVTSEVLLEDLITMEECQLPERLQLISIVALCFATMSSTPDMLSQMLYNLLEQCTFVNFTSQTIIEQIKKNDYVISKCDLNRFFICNSSCDMISFANVYIGVIKSIKDQYYEVSLDFSRLVLEDALRIWRRGAHYREMSRRYGSENDTAKAKLISTYLMYLVKGIQTVYGSVPSEIKELLDEVMKKSIHDLSQKVISEMAKGE